MKKRIIWIWITLILCLSLLPVAVLADRIAVTEIEASCPAFRAPRAGEAVDETFDFSVQTGSAARFVSKMRGWQRLDSSSGKFVDYTGEVFAAGTYRFKCQVRVDGKAGQSYYLGDPVTVTVNGEPWKTMTGPHVTSTYSYAWTYSPEYTLEVSVPSLAVVGLNEPVVGQHPDMTASVKADALYGLSVSVNWVKFVNGLGYDLGSWDVFEKDYRYGCYLTITSSYGCSFPSAPVVGSHGSINYEYTGAFSINGTKQQAYVYPEDGICGATWWLQPAKEKATLPFTDVKESDYFYEPVMWAVANDITTGTSSTKFSPAISCTRSQAVTFLWRAAGQPEPSTAANPFKDIKTSDYFYKAVLWAAENGITKGVSADRFGPGEPCTRSQVVTLLYRANGSPAVTGSTSFTDVRTKDYFYDAVLWAVQNHITTGTSSAKFSPDLICSRGQIVTFLYRAYAK